ncbi:uncharacterized protein LOC132199884 isoform X2 [Neocloeon triangulifer]|uniref:uncharacterized protein LOC132199884 isoform X2 n=1 Tax=Neocloeon triangulifer TaxID=2078957 RepID=UPI00286ED229|nr:uncharacterized protein LOC132199884 isoform X2 [Neocloeon triangulifer]
MQVTSHLSAAMSLKCIAILLVVSSVALAGRKDKDDFQRPSRCPYADEQYSMQDSEFGKKSPCSGYDRIDDCPRKERKAFEKQQSKKFKRPIFDDDEDDDVFPEVRRDPRWARDFTEDNNEFLAKKEFKLRKDKKDKKYKRDPERKLYEPEEDLDYEVSPQCQRYVHDINRLAKCERQVSSAEGKAKGGDYPYVCQQFAHDPYKLLKCVRKSNFWADFSQHPADFESQDVHPECRMWAHDPYKLSKCQYKLGKYGDTFVKKSVKQQGFY